MRNRWVRGGLRTTDGRGQGGSVPYVTDNCPV